MKKSKYLGLVFYYRKAKVKVVGTVYRKSAAYAGSPNTYYQVLALTSGGSVHRGDTFTVCSATVQRAGRDL